ncbi:unnamed protein product [Calypogeia fissa]
MQQVAELSVSSSSFFRGFAHHGCPSETVTGGAVKWPKLGAKVGAPVGLAVRCAVSSSSSAAASRGKHPRFSMVKKISLVGENGNRGDVSAEAAHKEGGSSRSFGASLQDEYDVSEPQKVNRTSLSQWTGADMLHRLKKGFVKFKEERFLKETSLFSQLAEGQQPKVMVIACADSRVCPTMLMGLNPGEVFTVRNVANLVPPCEKDTVSFHGTSAALEFAVTVLKVEHIIVIGHRNCGGIRALMSRKTTEIESDFIGRWMSCALPAKSHTLVQMEGKSFVDQCRFCEQATINGSLANLLTFPWIKESFEAGKLGLHGWYYDFVEGELTSWEVQHPSVEKSVEPSLVVA